MEFEFGASSLWAFVAEPRLLFCLCHRQRLAAIPAERERKIMSDLREKIKYLQDKNLSLYIEKNGETIFESYDPMLKPLFLCLRDRRDELSGATVVDKIVGRAAALLCILGNVEQVMTPLASETAREVLAEAGISLRAQKMIPYIVNRDNTGMCPMEKMANESAGAAAFYEKLKQVIR